MKGRPRKWSVYYFSNEEGKIYKIINSLIKVPNSKKYKSNLTENESYLLCKMMERKFPPLIHKSRLKVPWNKGNKSDINYKTSSVKANSKIKNKKDIWLNDTFIDKSCLYCHESESVCLIYYPDMNKIIKINNYLGILESRSYLRTIIENQQVVCLNCNSKLDIGLELF
jgi:hypothetical protein